MTDVFCSPQLCVGFLLSILYPGPPPPPPPAPPPSNNLSYVTCHTLFFTQLCHTHTSLSTTIFHTPFFTHHLSHTISHTHLCQPPFFTHHLSHTIFYTPSFTSFTHHLSHTISHTHLCQPPFFTHHLSHTIFYTPSFTHHLCQPSLSTTIFHTHLLRFTWQAWHLATWTSPLRGRRGTNGTGLALVARLGTFWLPVTPLRFAWQG